MKYVFLVLLLCTTAVQADGIVKKSNSGICHDRSSPYYEKTDHYKSYNNLEKCLQSGGRLPKHRAISQSSGKSYSRDAFGEGWSEGENPDDCLNTRHEILEKMSTSSISTSKNHCTVERGKWYGVYTGKTYYKAKALDIDHVIPLKWAWNHGAAKWQQSKRERFANDFANLLAVDAGANRSKGAKAPWEWMPPHEEYHCQYLLRFARITKQYGLRLSANEKSRFKALLQKDHCRMPDSLS